MLSGKAERWAGKIFKKTKLICQQLTYLFIFAITTIPSVPSRTKRNTE